MSKFDLSSLDTSAAAEAGAELELLHPATGEGLNMFVTLLGTDSASWRQAISRNLNRRGSGKRTPEKAMEENIETYAACTVGFRGVILDGQEIPFSHDNARMLYRRFPWMREQVDAFIGDRANFLPG